MFRNIDAAITIDAVATAAITPVYSGTAEATMDGFRDTVGEIAGISVADVGVSMGRGRLRIDCRVRGQRQRR
ncbi:hypothetical protein GS415_08745 [Rhodococcus hoagii]|nr:hypothetical protein [Prescottella equi]